MTRTTVAASEPTREGPLYSQREANGGRRETDRQPTAHRVSQFKLRISEPTDPLEQEADRLADGVVRQAMSLERIPLGHASGRPAPGDGTAVPSAAQHTVQRPPAGTAHQADEADLKEIGRWKSDTMVRRYSKTGKRARAFEAFQRHNPLG